MQIYTITHELPHLPLQSYVYPPPNFSHFPHRAAPFCLRYRTHPPLLLTIPVKKTLHTYPPSPNTSYEPPTSAHLYLPNHARPPTPTHLYLTTYAPTAPPLRTFTHQLTHEPPHICAPSPLLCVHFPKLLWEIAPPQRTFTRQSTQKQPHAHALTTSLLRTNVSLSAYLHQATYVRLRSFLLRRGAFIR